MAWAKRLGWLAFHVRNSGARGMTQVQGDSGFPDLILIRHQRMIVAELKVEKAGTVRGEPRADQQVWLQAFRHFLQYTDDSVFVWRPSDLQEIVRELRGF